MEISKLIQIEYHGELVLTTKQLSKFYGCSPRDIRKNYAQNKDKFVEGIHYFKLEGAALKDFKEYFAKIQAASGDSLESSAADFPFTKLASSLYLWTARGAARHCKIVGTQKAWDIFNILETNYFCKKDFLPPETIQPQKISAEIENLSPLEKLNRLDKYIDLCADENLRDDLIRMALNLLK